MISEKQLKANRENAKLGGVKTNQGKAISKFNALKHGILTRNILLPEEDETELIDFGKRIRMDLRPLNEIEMLLTERIIANTWRLKRALKTETQMIEYDMQNEKNFGIALSYDLAKNDNYGKFTRYETCIERGIYKALHELQRIQATRIGEKSSLPVAIDIDIAKE